MRPKLNFNVMVIGVLLIVIVIAIYVKNRTTSEKVITNQSNEIATSSPVIKEPVTDTPPATSAPTTTAERVVPPTPIKKPVTSVPAGAPPKTTASSVTSAPPVKNTPLPVYSSSTLAKFNGTNPDLPIYIAFQGNVYDVTAGKEFYEAGAVYNFLAGTDGTELLESIGGDIIKRKYPVIGTFIP